jgi:hypothetical protein
LVLSVAVMMAVMLGATAAPAFANKFFGRDFGNCGSKGISVGGVIPEFGETDFVTSPPGTFVTPEGGDNGGTQFHECKNN